MDNSNRYLSSDELLEKIFYFMEKLFEEKELSSTIGNLTELGKTMVNSERASFWFWDKKEHMAWTLAASEIGKISIPEDTGLIGYALNNNDSVITNDPYEDSRFNSDIDKTSGYTTKSILTMPVTNSEGEVIGAYQAVNKINTNKEPESFDETDIKRLALAATFCGKTLESHLLYNDALQDQLTLLKNRRGFYSFYEKRIESIIDKKPASIIICDIDHFKKVNDTWGHNAGDAILKMVAKIFLGSIGVDDAVFRWGGEEFVFVLPGKNIDEAAVFAEKCRVLIEESICEFQGLVMSVTMSFGVAQINSSLSPEENVKIADERLYFAKGNGRNCVVKNIPEA